VARSEYQPAGHLQRSLCQRDWRRGGRHHRIPGFHRKRSRHHECADPEDCQSAGCSECLLLSIGGGGACPPNTVCGTGADIDQWGELQGGLLDDTFVNVVVPLDPALNPNYTTTGNVDGTVATTSYAVSINADQTTPTGGNFDRWVTAPGGTIGSPTNDLNVGKLTDDYALALYHSACPNGSTWSTTPTESQCALNPTCPNGEYWNTTLKRCEVSIGPNPICHMCPKGESCTEVGLECNCLRCTPEGQSPQPFRPMVK